MNGTIWNQQVLKSNKQNRRRAIKEYGSDKIRDIIEVSREKVEDI